MGFGTKLREYRERYGMNQATLARRVGITPEHLNRIEHEIVSPPKMATIARIIEELRLSSEDVAELLAVILAEAKEQEGIDA